MSDTINNKKIILQIVDKIQLEIQFSNELERYWIWTERDDYNNIRHYATYTTVEHKKEISPSVRREILEFFGEDDIKKNLAAASMHITSHLFRERYFYDCWDSKSVKWFYETVVLKYQKNKEISE